MPWAFGRRTISCIKGCSAIILTVIICSLLVSFPSVQAQAPQGFTTSDTFNIPSRSSQIRFAVNGSYSSATLQDNIWTFSDLQFNSSPNLKLLEISAENSNITVLSYQTRNATSQRVANEVLRYQVVGEGKVTINLGLSSAGKYSGSDWYVSKPGRNQTTFLSLGHDYILENDGTLIINGLTGNVSITHMFLDSFPGNNVNLPIYQQHSVIIVVAIVLLLTIAVVFVIRLRNNRVDSKLTNNGVDA